MQEKQIPNIHTYPMQHTPTLNTAPPALNWQEWCGTQQQARSLRTHHTHYAHAPRSATRHASLRNAARKGAVHVHVHPLVCRR